MSTADWAPIRERYPEVFDGGMWYSRAGSFIVRAPDTTMLIDTGVGPDPLRLSAACGGGC
jgi:hypothetical protein